MFKFNEKNMLCLAALLVVNLARADEPPEIVNRDPVVVDYRAFVRGELKDTGGEETEVFVYYGLTDGVTNKSAWEYSRSLGIKEAGKIDVKVKCTQITNYYYTFYATNNIGDDWAEGTEVFAITGESGGSGYSPAEVEQMVEEDRQRFINKLKARGETPGEILQTKYDMGYIDEPSSWQEWVEQHNAVFHDSPFVFNIEDEFSYNLDTLSNAYRSVFHAIGEQNPSALYAVADESEKNRMRGISISETSTHTDKMITLIPALTEVAYLAKYDLYAGGNHYYRLVFRKQRPNNPKDFWVAYWILDFKKYGDEYKRTNELDGFYDDIFKYANVTETDTFMFKMGIYSNAYEVLSESELPPSFYTIE